MTVTASGPAGDRPERRQQPRYQVSFPVVLDEAGLSSLGSCINISARGMGVHSERNIPSGTSVNVLFSLPDKRYLNCPAAVVRNQGAFLGLRFDDLERDETYMLAGYLFWLGTRQRMRFPEALLGCLDRRGCLPANDNQPWAT